MFWTVLLTWFVANWLPLVFRVGPLLLIAAVLGIEWFTGTVWARLGFVLLGFNALLVALEVVGWVPGLPALPTIPVVPPSKS